MGQVQALKLRKSKKQRHIILLNEKVIYFKCPSKNLFCKYLLSTQYVPNIMCGIDTKMTNTQSKLLRKPGLVRQELFSLLLKKAENLEKLTLVQLFSIKVNQSLLICFKSFPLLNFYVQYTKALTIINQPMDTGIANKPSDQIPL